jgi:hypothetical protein
MKSLLALALILMGNTLPATARDLSLTSFSGQEVVAHKYISRDENCKNNGGIVALTTKPHHGRAIPHRVMAPMGKSYFTGSTYCRGKIAEAFEVSYRSVPGFRGTDTFTIKYTNGAGQSLIDSYIVNVQ